MRKLVPNLRFSEFNYNWESCKLCDLAEIKSASRVHKEQWTESGVPFFRTSDVVSIYKGKENNKAFISTDLFKKLSKKSDRIKKNDLLITGGGSIGIPYLVPNDAPLYFKDADLLWLKTKEIADGFYLYSFFLTPQFKRHLRNISHTGTISHYTIEQAKSTPINIPSPKEQQKIADFLTSVDTKISQITEKHRQLKEYKKGVMQQIFSQQIRFKDEDGKAFPEWKATTLIKLSSEGISNGVFNDPQKIGSGYRLINVKDMYVGNSIDTSQLTLLRLNDSLFQKNKVKFGDIFFTRSSIVPSGIAYSNVNLSHDEDLTFDGHLMKISPRLDIVEPLFLAYYLRSHTLRKKLVSRGKQSTMTTIGQEDIKDIELFLPEIKEQQKIAAFLQSIDDKIDAVAKQIDYTKQFKQGLLQQMFV